MSCPACGDERWVCEAHPDRPWDDTAPDGTVGCQCGAPGQPCGLCNSEPDQMPAFPPGSTEIWHAPYAPPATPG